MIPRGYSYSPWLMATSRALLCNFVCIYFCGRDKRGLYCGRSNFEVSKTLRDSIPNNLSRQARMQLRVLLRLVDVTNELIID